MYSTLISPEQLMALQAAKARLMVFDCTFDLMDPAKGEKQYLQAHIPGAVYADLDHALSDKGTPDVQTGEPQPHAGAASGGRHPLPSREKFAMWLSRVGLANDMQAVVYDRNGANYCGRLWWMLKWAGHEAVAVLDGGLQAWQAAGGEVRAGAEPSHFQSNFELGEPLRRLVGTGEVAAGLNGGQTLIDARAPQRFRGEVEPLDPVAGHIPGALNRPFAQNIGPDGKFKPPQQLRAEFEQLLAGRDPAGVVHHCGSGVSAVPNVIAMELAGYPPAGLYAGSWSEWCRDPKLPVAKG
ncbi:MAG TPA: sulfurtransferase [Ramlibacter sp.]|jgi:thiosulfate/3-mercaptopyruvate sulfurtransferase|nr:sulfurtransferase [Ramlibacter sp.]